MYPPMPLLKQLYSHLPVLDDILESLAETNAEAKRPKFLKQ
jgi:hypothetical protein